MARRLEVSVQALEGLAPEVGRLCRLPSEFREFTVTSSGAEKRYGLPPRALGTLVDAGLPHRSDGKSKLFHAADLAYLGIRLGTARAHLTKFAVLSKSLTRFAAQESGRFTVRYVPLLRDESTPAAGTVSLPDGERRDVELTHNEVAAESSITLSSAHPQTPPPLETALADAEPVHLYTLPAAVRHEVAFTRRTGLGGCYTAAHLVAECCRDAGYEARVAEGLMVAIPWSSDHYWAEARVEGRWLPLDPLMIREMRAFGGLDTGTWPLHRSPAPMLARFPPGSCPLVAARSDGSRIEATLLTSAHRAS